MSYLAWKTIHILSVVIFLGNITTGILWKALADRSGKPEFMAHTLDGIIRSDRWFTIPGVIGIAVSGPVLAMKGGLPIFGTFWIWAGLALFGLSGVLFMIWIAPMQKKLRDIAAADSFDEAAYRRASVIWAASGFAALLAPVIALVLMVVKPA